MVHEPLVDAESVHGYARRICFKTGPRGSRARVAGGASRGLAGSCRSLALSGSLAATGSPWTGLAGLASTCGVICRPPRPFTRVAPNTIWSSDGRGRVAERASAKEVAMSSTGIGEFALLSDLHWAALVGRDGSI